MYNSFVGTLRSLPFIGSSSRVPFFIPQNFSEHLFINLSIQNIIKEFLNLIFILTYPCDPVFHLLKEIFYCIIDSLSEWFPYISDYFLSFHSSGSEVFREAVSQVFFSLNFIKLLLFHHSLEDGFFFSAIYKIKSSVKKFMRSSSFFDFFGKSDDSVPILSISSCSFRSRYFVDDIDFYSVVFCNFFYTSSVSKVLEFFCSF
nr:MAG TPA: hypothetical protein [Caudoviricetes sp.]